MRPEERVTFSHDHLLIGDCSSLNDGDRPATSMHVTCRAPPPMDGSLDQHAPLKNSSLQLTNASGLPRAFKRAYSECDTPISTRPQRSAKPAESRAQLLPPEPPPSFDTTTLHDATTPTTRNHGSQQLEGSGQQPDALRPQGRVPESSEWCERHNMASWLLLTCHCSGDELHGDGGQGPRSYQQRAMGYVGQGSLRACN